MEPDLFNWAESRAAIAPPRRERCTICQQLVEDWIDPDWSKGRICRKCESLHEPPVGPAVFENPPKPAPEPNSNSVGATWARDPECRTVFALRDYQEEARKNVWEAFKTTNKALIVMPTGAGKTIEFAALTADFHPQRVLILTDQELLVDQAVEKIHSATGIFADVEQSERTASRNAKVIVATVQSMKARLAKYPPDHFALVVCDECDRAVTPQWMAVLKHFDGHAKVLGVTATPKRSDKKNILNYFEKKVFEISMLELMDRGYLAAMTIQDVPIEINLEAVETKGTDFDQEQLATAVEAIFGEVAKAIKQYAPTRKILVFTPDRQTSRKFVMTCHQHELNARHIDGLSTDKDELKRGFREWRPMDPPPNTFQILSNPILLGRGFDDPSIDCVINLRPTQSISLYQQIVGRGTRIFCPHGCGKPCTHEARKKDLLVLDFLYQFKTLGPVRPSMLIADTDNQARKMTEISQRMQMPLDLRELKEMAEREIEADLVKAMMEAQAARPDRAKREYFNAFQWAANLELPDLTDYEPETPAEAVPVKKGLMTKLKEAGFIPETITCQGHAERIWKVIQARRDAGLASFKQVYWLRRKGYRDPMNYTREEAGNILTREFRR